ncbi:sialate O-acetylesterase [Neorhodopirellula lusitana]|uniref:Sialate O-acetylesterase n=1 Tax=Neorhodopirellula lusitana TaxID=445327 RepID=A0ABY1Q561_9BACT|nr:sialate O-acetylesterase [Neorhodopirellula lusitana]SMP59989.1 sialate O-acetylesterase [Neorhodopirellula lusitana]
MSRFMIVLAFAMLLPAAAQAELSVPNFFSDHMVLQRERAASIWGKATPGAEVIVGFKDNNSTVKTGDDGRWRVGVETGKADATGADLTIQSGDDSITLHDVLVGEVWFASGQSNMAFTMNRVPAYADLIAKADHPQIRMFNAQSAVSVEPKDDIRGEWTLCNPESVPSYSAVAFFFARKLHTELDIPIGVIKSAWGGKPVETFTSREALNTLPGTKALVDAVIQADAKYDEAKSQVAYQARLDQWTAAAKAQRKLPADQRKKLPRKPTKPKRPLATEGKPGVLFNSMIHPFVGYTMRGAIWYQGEANAKPGAVPYDQTLPLMIRDWRERWNDDLSFYFVQLANFHQPSTEPGTPDLWALLQDRMRLILDTTPKTGMATINDVGEANDIHPKNKQAPGERLARWALVKDYGKDLVYSGPLFRSSNVNGNAIEVTFDQAGEGLKSRNNEQLKRFEIAGQDRVWHWADAKVEGTDSVLVSSEEVPNPVAVRYAWAANPEGANLVNSEGLPASIFRTDDWDDVEPIVEQKAKPRQATRRELAK